MNLLSHLRRIATPGRTFIPEIDGLRFVAIMAVIAYHVRVICSYHLRASPDGTAIEGDLVNDVFFTGHFGVQLFFAVSGFILSVPFARHWLAGDKPVSLRRYYVRRVTRIEPPYLIHLAFLFVLCVGYLRYQPTHLALYQNENGLIYSAKHILASLFYCNGFIYGDHPYPNVVLWSLEVEVQFYLLAPLLAQIFRINQAMLRRGLILAIISLTPWIQHQVGTFSGNWYLAGFSLAGNLQYFLVGFLLADWHTVVQNPAPAPRPKNWVWDFLFIGSIVFLICFRHAGWLYIALPILIGICSLAAFLGSLTSLILSHPWITAIGGMCYTTYMYHYFMITFLIRGAMHFQTHRLWLDLLIEFLVMSAVIIPVSAVLFVFLERPFMKPDWPARLRAKMTGVPAS